MRHIVGGCGQAIEVGTKTVLIHCGALRRRIVSIVTALSVVCAGLSATFPQAAHSAVPVSTEAASGEVPSQVRLVRVRFIPDNGPDSDASAMDAAGCNQNVCIALTGSGTYLSKWRTTATVTSSTCSYARFHRNDTVIRTSATICSPGSGTLEAIWQSPGYFTDGDKLCNSWNGISGYPCKYIQH